MGIDPVNAAEAVNQLKLQSEDRSLWNVAGLQLPNKLTQDILIHNIPNL